MYVLQETYRKDRRLLLSVLAYRLVALEASQKISPSQKKKRRRFISVPTTAQQGEIYGSRFAS
jgi:hypothetical protein